MVSHTTGTTGRVTWRHRTRAEAAVIAKLFGSRPDLREDPRFGISIRYNRHGMEMPVPGVGTMVPVSLSEDVDVRQVLELLQVGCVLHGVRRHPSVLAGGGMDVAIIARAIVEAGFADAAARIDRVLVGGHLPKAIRATVERALPQATISGHYSLAEVFGGASSLPDGSGYLTEAHVIAEVLDDDDADAGGVVRRAHPHGGLPVRPGSARDPVPHRRYRGVPPLRGAVARPLPMVGQTGAQPPRSRRLGPRRGPLG